MFPHRGFSLATLTRWRMEPLFPSMVDSSEDGGPAKSKSPSTKQVSPPHTFPSKLIESKGWEEEEEGKGKKEEKGKEGMKRKI